MHQNGRVGYLPSIAARLLLRHEAAPIADSAQALRAPRKRRVRDASNVTFGFRRDSIFASLPADAPKAAATAVGAVPATRDVMTTGHAPGLGHASRGVRSSHLGNELDEALQLATHLSARLAKPLEGERADGVRMRLARAHALSLVDLLTDIATDCARRG
jgi:hypothetical protein